MDAGGEESRCAIRLTLLQAGWTDIVGVEVAANSAPVRVADGTLVIVTRSSAWSHQLSFLADRVLAAVAARLPGAGVERLRFRVGVLPKRNAPRVARLSGQPRAAARRTRSVGQRARGAGTVCAACRSRYAD